MCASDILSMYIGGIVLSFRRGKRKKIDIPPLPPTNISLNLKPKDNVEQFAKKKHKKKKKRNNKQKL